MNFLSLNNFDLLILGLLGSSVIFGLARGFIKSFISLTGWIVSMGIGMKFYFLLEPLVSKYITFSVLAAVVAGITLFLVSAIVIAIINNIFYIALDSICGGLLDRSLGLLLGFVRGCLLVSFMFYILLMIMPQLNAIDQDKIEEEHLTHSSNQVPLWAKGSESILLLSKGAAFIDEFIPIDFERKLREALLAEKTGAIERGLTNSTPEYLKSPKDNKDNTNRDSISTILNFLPKEVLNKLSQDDLILLQDKSAKSKEKVKILENISKEYQQYIDEEDTEHLTRDELNKRDLKYYKHMSIIENQIIDYSDY